MKTIISALLIGIVCFLGYWVFEMYPFANGVIEDMNQKDEIRLPNTFRDGDIIFQTSKSNQSEAIQVATGSEYSHMGIVYENEGKVYVYEAVQPVKITPVKEWIERGKSRHYVLKRLINANQLLDDKAIARMKLIGKKYQGKPYDIYFEWSDERIYCSELVWKIYKEALNIEIGQLESLSDFNLEAPIVKAKMEERYGNTFPMQEKVISPAAMYNSSKLMTVESR